MGRRDGLLYPVTFLTTIFVIFYLYSKIFLAPKVGRLFQLDDDKTFHRFPAPFSEDPLPELIRNNTQYNRMSLVEAKSGKASRPVRVYADGIFDLFHQGHANMLKQAKSLFPNVYLIVGVCGDKDTHANKGLTVMTDLERYEAVRHNRYVDEVVKNGIWVIDENFLNYHKIDFVAHDDEETPSNKTEDVYAQVKALGMFIGTKRTKGVSTSDLIRRIIKSFNLYVKRNIDRGYTEQQLNVVLNTDTGIYNPVKNTAS